MMLVLVGMTIDWPTVVYAGFGALVTLAATIGGTIKVFIDHLDRKDHKLWEELDHITRRFGKAIAENTAVLKVMGERLDSHGQAILDLSAKVDSIGCKNCKNFAARRPGEDETK